MKKKFLAVAAAACLAGAVLSLISTSHYFRIQKGGLAERSFCSFSELVNCDIATTSSYAVFWGIPVSWFGFLTYLLIAGMSLYSAISSQDRKITVSISWFLSLFSVLYSVYMAYILFYVLQAVCVDCIGMYLANLVTAICIWLALDIQFKKIFSFFRDNLKEFLFGRRVPYLKHITLVLAVYFVGWSFMYNEVSAGAKKSYASPEEKIKAHYIQSLYDIEIGNGWAMWGNPDALVTVIEFSDFECPFCRLSSFKFRPYLTEFRKDVRYYFVNHPLTSECNPSAGHKMHQKACMAAEAAICVKDLGGDFWVFHDELFRLGGRFSKEDIEGLARLSGVDKAKFMDCWQSPETKERLASEVQVGIKAYVEGVPTIFINGRKFRYWQEPEMVRGVIKEELKRSVSKKTN